MANENTQNETNFSFFKKRYIEKLFCCICLDKYLSKLQYTFLGKLHHQHSVSGRNKCMCGSSHTLCYECMQSCVTHNSFASYDEDVIHACCTNKAGCQ